MRMENDFYPTPGLLTRQLLERVQLSGTVLEPCAGDGAIADELGKVWSIDKLLTNDLFREGCNFQFGADDLVLYQKIEEQHGGVDWVVTNPPYKQPLCQEIIQRAWENARQGICMLLRLSYLEPCGGRAEFLKHAYLSNLIVFNPRPRFRPDKKGTDSSTVAWFVWSKEKYTYGTTVSYCTNWDVVPKPHPEPDPEEDIVAFIREAQYKHDLNDMLRVLKVMTDEDDESNDEDD